MSRVLGAGIRDVLEGREEDMHGRDELRRVESSHAESIKRPAARGLAQSLQANCDSPAGGRLPHRPSQEHGEILGGLHSILNELNA